MPTERVTFEGSTGARLSARLELPADGRPATWALFAHCFTCSKSSRAAVDLTRGLSAQGIGVLRFDFTGLGESQGDFADTGFSSNVGDLIRAAEWVEAEHGPPELLVGHSLGGAAVLHAARRIRSVRAVATLGAPADTSHVLRHVRGARREIETRGHAEVSIGGRPFRIGRQLLEDLEATTMEEAVTDLGRALLILHSPADTVVGVENAAELYRMARHPKSFVAVDGADHLLTDSADSQWVAGVLASWVSRYLRAPAPETDADELTAGERVVARTGAQGYRTDIRARRHSLVVDEPESLGGGDAGPTPYDLLAAALGACTSITLRMYADRKGWPLDEIRVRLRHRKLHRRDEEECQEGRDGRLDRIDREIELRGDLDTGQRARLLEIADRCPVHRTLEAGVRLETKGSG